MLARTMTFFQETRRLTKDHKYNLSKAIPKIYFCTGRVISEQKYLPNDVVRYINPSINAMSDCLEPDCKRKKSQRKMDLRKRTTSRLCGAGFLFRANNATKIYMTAFYFASSAYTFSIYSFSYFLFRAASTNDSRIQLRSGTVKHHMLRGSICFCWRVGGWGRTGWSSSTTSGR